MRPNVCTSTADLILARFHVFYMKCSDVFELNMKPHRHVGGKLKCGQGAC